MYVRTYASRPTGPAFVSPDGGVPGYDDALQRAFVSPDGGATHGHIVMRFASAPDAQERAAELAGHRKEEDQYLAQNLNPARRGWKRTDETRG